MWCVPKPHQRYIANMEDVLALFERLRHFTIPIIVFN